MSKNSKILTEGNLGCLFSQLVRANMDGGFNIDVKRSNIFNPDNPCFVLVKSQHGKNDMFRTVALKRTSHTLKGPRSCKMIVCEFSNENDYNHNQNAKTICEKTFWSVTDELLSNKNAWTEEKNVAKEKIALREKREKYARNNCEIKTRELDMTNPKVRSALLALAQRRGYLCKTIKDKDLVKAVFHIRESYMSPHLQIFVNRNGISRYVHVYPHKTNDYSNTSLKYVNKCAAYDDTTISETIKKLIYHT